MIVKLKCVDTCGYNYFTKYKVYEAKSAAGEDYYFVIDDDEMLCVVSTDISHYHGKWEVVN